MSLFAAQCTVPPVYCAGELGVCWFLSVVVQCLQEALLYCGCASYIGRFFGSPVYHNKISLGCSPVELWPMWSMESLFLPPRIISLYPVVLCMVGIRIGSGWGVLISNRTILGCPSILRVLVLLVLVCLAICFPGEDIPVKPKFFAAPHPPISYHGEI